MIDLRHLKKNDIEGHVDTFIGIGRKITSDKSLPQIQKFLAINESFRESLEMIRKNTKINIGIAWPPDCGLENLGIDPYDMEVAARRSARQIVKDFGEHSRDFDFSKS